MVQRTSKQISSSLIVSAWLLAEVEVCLASLRCAGLHRPKTCHVKVKTARSSPTHGCKGLRFVFFE